MDFNTEMTNNIPEGKAIYRPFDNGFAKAAFILGIVGVVTTFFGLATVPMALGGMAVLLALLSRGKGEMNNKAIAGLVTGIVAVVLNLFLIFLVIWLFISNSAYRQVINAQYESMYGYTINEMIEGSVGGDFNLEDYLQN